MPIRQLPPELVNQIAAGEVIERPANVVKELIENALDAGANRIEVHSEGGGSQLLRITDDGAGITREELSLALAAHATSKIASIDDLESVGTMGFRGEALASIASVSMLRLRSRRHDADEAWVIEAEGGPAGKPQPASGPPGTSLEVRSLFFNVPARRKFLKTDPTEQARISEIVQTIAMANPGCAFTLRLGDRTTLDLPAVDDPRSRVVALLGKELSDELLEVDFEAAGATIWGLAGTPQIAGPTARRQRVFLNGRPIRDKAIQHALREAYRGLVVPGRHPTVVLFIELDPRLVDVNVSPTKSEVRFRDGGAIHQAVRHALKNTLRKHDLVPTLDLDRSGTDPSTGSSSSASGFGGGSGGGSSSRGPAREFGSGLPSPGFEYQALQSQLAKPVTPAETLMPSIQKDLRILQVHAKYILVEDAEGVLVIDQHALHERVMFEQLKARIGEGDLERQHLLVPDVVEVDESAIESLETLSVMVAKIGFDARPIGPKAISLSAVPSFLLSRNVEPGEFLIEALAFGSEKGRVDDAEALLSEVLDMMACKAAVKAGDRLTQHELEALLAQRDSIERSTNCPHGRPTSLRIPIAELDRRFGRSS
jgi:DNA mismatch repair protein MutL